MQQNLLEALRLVKINIISGNIPATYNEHGLCWAIKSHIKSKNTWDMLMLLEPLLGVWPEGTGDSAYPIAGSMEFYQENEVSKLHPSHPNFTKRMRLLNWLIQHFEEKVNAQATGYRID